ncbi:MAG: hypothetical protein LBT39_04225 [Treponema sp.]|jgi:hypothetical protein|nr:hypothetical protein [Treponema sp.]
MTGKFQTLLSQGRFALIASLPANDPSLAKAAWDNGADAVKIHINVSHRASGTHFGSFDEERPRLEQILGEARGPVGIVLGAEVDAADKDLEKVVAAGFDFISIYAHHGPLRLLDANITKMLAADYSYSSEEIKTLSSLADIFEASLIAPEHYREPLSLRDLAAYKNITTFLNIPVVVPTQKKITPEEAPLLFKAGVNAIMIGAVSAGKTVEEFGAKTAEFRRAMDIAEKGSAARDPAAKAAGERRC